MFAALIAAAIAADTVVYAGGDAALVVARVAALSGTSPSALRAVTVTDLVKGRPPALLGGGKLQSCGGGPSATASVRQSVDLAKGAIAYMEYGSARAALDVAIRDLGCLQEPIDPVLATRAWFLLGVVATASNDPATSRLAFRQARLFSPDMMWDDNFAPAARAVFDNVAAEMKTTPMVSLTVIPEPTDGTLRLDGRPVKVVGGHVGVLPGSHQVQVGTGLLATMSVDIDANAPATLVLPALVTADALTWAGDGERRAALSSVLMGALGSEGVVYVVSGDIVWRVRLGGSAWDLVGAGGPGAASAVRAIPSTRFAAKELVPPRKANVAGPVILGVGGAALIGGGIVAGLGFRSAKEAYDDAVANGRGAEGDAAYEAGAREYTAGLVVGGVGAALAATGIVVTVAF